MQSSSNISKISVEKKKLRLTEPDFPLSEGNVSLLELDLQASERLLNSIKAHIAFLVAVRFADNPFAFWVNDG